MQTILCKYCANIRQMFGNKCTNIVHPQSVKTGRSDKVAVSAQLGG